MLQVYQLLFLCPKIGKPGCFSPKKATRVGLFFFFLKKGPTDSRLNSAMRVVVFAFDHIYKVVDSTTATATASSKRNRQASTKKQHVLLLIREVCFRIDSYFTSSAAQHCIVYYTKQTKQTQQASDRYR